MMKELKEQEKKEQSPSTPVKEKQETIQFFQSTFIFSFNSFQETKKQNTIYLLAKTQEVTFSIFHPPTV